MSISRRLRFEVLRRDGFACQYCGRRPPNVNLEVDHRIPRSQGGGDDPGNLIAACWDCNRGKGSLPFKGSEPEYWETEGFASWEEWMKEGGRDSEWSDELPWWLCQRRDRSVLQFDFDIYAAAKEIARADKLEASTLDSILLRAQVFDSPKEPLDG